VFFFSSDGINSISWLSKQRPLDEVQYIGQVYPGLEAVKVDKNDGNSCRWLKGAPGLALAGIVYARWTTVVVTKMPTMRCQRNRPIRLAYENSKESEGHRAVPCQGY